MDSSFKAVHLLLPELNYELRIRNIVTQKSFDDKRKILGRLLVKEKQQNFNVSTLQDPNFDLALERAEIETTLTSLENLIGDFDGPSTDSCFKRAVSRLNHVTQRIQRIPIEGITEKDKDIVRQFKNEVYATALKLEADLFERVKDPDPNTLLNNSILDPNLLNSTIRQTIPVSSPSKFMPVYKLGIQYDGNPKGLLSFIEKVEEVASARSVSKTDLFQSASDLFRDKATFWFRQVKSSVNSWDTLVEKLKKDFLPSDYEDEVWNQIKTRKQGRSEPVVLYIACMETLFVRLSHSPAEVTKIKYIKQGLQAEYQKRLALSDVDSIELLSKLCKKLEEADVLSLASSSTQKSSLEPELAYFSEISCNSKINNQNFSQKNSSSKNNNQNQCRFYNKNKKQQRNNFQNKAKVKTKSTLQSDTKNKTTNLNINAVEFNPNQNKNAVSCWSCGLANHTFRNCLAPVKTRFCFKCGAPNVTVKECKNCAGNV